MAIDEVHLIISMSQQPDGLRWLIHEPKAKKYLASAFLRLPFPIFPPGGVNSGGIPKWPKGADCKSAAVSLRRFESSSHHFFHRYFHRAR